MEKLEQDYNIFDWWKKVVLNNYTNFNGRARRKEYWSFQLVNFIFILPIYLLTIFTMVSTNDGSSPSMLSFIPLGLILLYAFAIFIPSLAVAVRRLHDTDRSGWFFLLSFVPLVSLVMLYFYFSEGTMGTNNYGDDPKNPSNDIQEIGTE